MTEIVHGINELQAKFNYATYEHIQLEKTRDMVNHGNYGYALEILKEYEFSKFVDEYKTLCQDLEKYMSLCHKL